MRREGLEGLEREMWFRCLSLKTCYNEMTLITAAWRVNE